MAAVQKKMESGSIVMTKAPMLKIGVTFNPITTQKPVTSLKRRRVR